MVRVRDELPKIVKMSSVLTQNDANGWEGPHQAQRCMGRLHSSCLLDKATFLFCRAVPKHQDTNDSETQERGARALLVTRGREASCRAGRRTGLDAMGQNNEATGALGAGTGGGRGQRAHAHVWLLEIFLSTASREPPLVCDPSLSKARLPERQKLPVPLPFLRLNLPRGAQHAPAIPVLSAREAAVTYVAFGFLSSSNLEVEHTFITNMYTS